MRVSPTFVRLDGKRLSPRVSPIRAVRGILGRTTSRLDRLNCRRPGKCLPLERTIDRCLTTSKVSTSPSSVLVISKKLRTLRLISLNLIREKTPMFLRGPSCLCSLRLFQSSNVGLGKLPVSGRKIVAGDVSLGGCRGKGSVLCAVPSCRGPAKVLVARGEQERLLSIYEVRRLPVIRSSVCHRL